MAANVNYSVIQELLSSVWPEWRVTGIAARDDSGNIYEILRNDLGTDFKCTLKVLRMKGEQQGNMISLGHLYINMPGASSVSVEEEDLEKFTHIVSGELNTLMKLRGIPNIVSIEDYAIVREPGMRTILIRAEGLESLNDHIRRTGALTRREIIRLGSDICTALSHIERLGIVHGNVRADNIFHSERAGYKLGDFGFSRTVYSVKDEKTISGAFSAPPAENGLLPGQSPSAVPGTSDICALGLLLDRLVHSSAVSAPVGPALENVIRRACSPDPTQRFRNADQFKNALQNCPDDSLPAALPEVKASPSKALPIVLYAAFLAFAAAACIFFYWRTGGFDKDAADDAAPSANTAPAEENTALFDDPALEYAVRRSTGIPEGEISGEMADNVRSLDLSGLNENKYGKISDISGLSMFPMLETLDLSDNQIADISELSSLTHLKVLRLGSNKIDDISSLSALGQLQELDLSINAVSDISALATLTDLTALDAGSNNITYIDSLENLENLQTLSLDVNHVADISPLAGLDSLTLLGLSYNEIEDYSPLANLKKLSDLNLRGNNIKNISSISKLSFLKKLDISDNNIDDLSPLEDLPDTVEVISD